MNPKRIQRRRTKGWRMPEGAIYVGRGSTWGNPFRVGDTVTIHTLPDADGRQVVREMVVDAAIAVALYRQAFAPDLPDIITQLRGKDLACWCPLDQPCHADVLLELANGVPRD